MEQNDIIEIDLLKLIQALLKKAWLIILAAVIAAAAMFVYSKMSYTPKYYAFATLYVQGSEGDLTYSSSDASMRIKTLTSFVGTKTVADEVDRITGLGLDQFALSDLVTVGSLGGSELLIVSTTLPDPEEAILLVNAVAEVLPEYAEMIHGEDTLVIFEKAYEATEADSGNSAVKKAVVAAILAACLVCVVIVIKEFYLDWKTHNTRNK